MLGKPRDIHWSSPLSHHLNDEVNQCQGKQFALSYRNAMTIVST